jgi:phosphopantothenoylcysteine decarboxylase/phosphopantothenate--cysteine ligase
MATVLITAGPTREYLDAVRFLSNGSTGRMGYALARAALAAGHRVLLVSGPTPLPPPAGAEVHAVESALEMAAAVDRCLSGSDVVFGAAAVADERPAHRIAGKPPKASGARMLELVPNPDIIAGVAARAGQRAVLGFALEAPESGGTEAALARGRSKLAAKRLDAIAVNTREALGAEESEVVVLFADGREQRLPRQSKDATARHLVEVGVQLWRSKR